MISKALLIRTCALGGLFVGGLTWPAVGRVSPPLARHIMGKNFLGVEELSQHFHIRLTREELAKVRDIPFSESTLRQCKDSHILFLGVGWDTEGKPLTITRLREMFPVTGQPRFRSYPKSPSAPQEYADQATAELRWYLIASSLREESRSKPYWQQELFLKENEYRERAVVYVYMILLMFKARGERLFEKDLVWCNDVGTDGATVAAGYFGPEGLYVSDWWVRRDHHFGIAPARKPDVP